MGDMYKRILALCNTKGIKPGRICTDTGLSRGLITDLKMGRTKELSAKNTKIIADYFGVTTDYLLGTETEKAPTFGLTAKNERDIAKKLQETLDDLENDVDGLMFDGEPLDDETKELLRDSLQNQLQMTKLLAKKKFTPKKYRQQEKE